MLYVIIAAGGMVPILALYTCRLIYAKHGTIVDNFRIHGALCSTYYTVSQKARDYIFYNNFNYKCPITITFGIVSSKSICHRKMVSFTTSPI